MSSVKRKTCRRCNFSRASFHVQNCPRSEFSLNLNSISKIRTEVQIEIQLAEGVIFLARHFTFKIVLVPNFR